MTAATPPRELIERVIERMEMDINDGGRPDQWSLESMVNDLRKAIAAPAHRPPAPEPDDAFAKAAATWVRGADARTQPAPDALNGLAATLVPMLRLKGDTVSLEAARTIEQQARELAEEIAIRERLAHLLAETVVVLRGPEPELTRWSYHDIPQQTLALRERAERAESLAEARGRAVDAANVLFSELRVDHLGIADALPHFKTAQAYRAALAAIPKE